MSKWSCVGILVLIAQWAPAQVQESGNLRNPLLDHWNTPFASPPFDQIRDEHFLPAFIEGIKEQRDEVKSIITNTQTPTFGNTIEALDATGELLDKIAAVLRNLTSADTNDKRQEIARKVAPLTSALQDDILLDEHLFARVTAVWRQRNELKLSTESRKLLEDTYKRFVRGGANLPGEKKQRLRAVNQELALLSLRFADNLLKETNDYRLIIDRKEMLRGLPETVVASAAAAAESSQLPGKWLFTLHAPSIWPFLTYAEDRGLREQIQNAYISRADRGGQYDNKPVLTRIAMLRAERARMLGYNTHADFILEERMAKTPPKVLELLTKLWRPAVTIARREAETLLSRARQEDRSFKLEPWDWWYYAEKVRKSQFNLDESEIRNYFSLDNVRQGAFHVANRLYGLQFQELADLPTYHPEVRSFEVKDARGHHLGLFLTDYHPRPGKRGGAWSSRYRTQHFRNGKDVRPIVVNVCNFTRPVGNEPALLSLEEVRTLFHEFGHGLHSLLSRIHYQSLSAVPRDFVELPSQIMEHWALEPEVLKVYAKHWKSGDPIPEDLVSRMRKAEKFNQGFATVEYLAASFLDMDWHTVGPEGEMDVRQFEKDSLHRIGLIPEIVSRYRSPYFAHIWSGGYSAGYYSYIWSEVLDTDAFRLFQEKGIFDPATAESFRTEILEKGGSDDAMEMYKRFRGREPSVEPLLEKRGLKPSEP